MRLEKNPDTKLDSREFLSMKILENTLFLQVSNLMTSRSPLPAKVESSQSCPMERDLRELGTSQGFGSVEEGKSEHKCFSCDPKIRKDVAASLEPGDGEKG